MVTISVSVIWSLPKPCVLKQLFQKGKQSLLLVKHRRFLPFLFSLGCQVYYDSLHVWIKTARPEGNLALIGTQISELHCRMLVSCETRPFTFLRQIFPKECSLSYWKTKYWIFPVGSIRLFGYYWWLTKPSLCRSGEFMTKAFTGHNGQTQQKRWKEMCSQSSCALQEDLPLFL